MKKIYSSIRGMSDFDPSRSLAFGEIIEKAKGIFKIFNYKEIILPILEERNLFIKGIGQSTDIVERQMFKIEGKDIALRPEGTAQVIRYYLQNSLYKSSDFDKFFYTGAMFRGEKPQKGRLRQFHHLGAEAIGSDSFYLDAEMIILALAILDAVGLSNRELKINTLGCVEDKVKFSQYLKKNLASRKNKLCDDCQKRSEKNPLRVLDCKREQCRKEVVALNLEKEHLCNSCHSKFKNLLALLDDLGIKYTYSPYMVRGLDYYTDTVFEISSDKLGSKDAIGAGGRYNNLIKYLGGPDIPAIGFALGLERILLSLGEKRREEKLDVFVAVTNQELLALGVNILGQLRGEGLSCDLDYCAKSLKAQMRSAQKKGSRVVVILGEEEVKKNILLLKDMEKSTQEKVNREDLVLRVKKLINLPAGKAGV